MPMQIYTTCLDTFQKKVPMKKSGLGQLYIPKYWYDLVQDPVVRVQVLLLPHEEDDEALPISQGKDKMKYGDIIVEPSGHEVPQ